LACDQTVDVKSAHRQQFELTIFECLSHLLSHSELKPPARWSRHCFMQVITALTQAHNLLKEMNTHAILCHLVKFLNYVAYGHILIKRVTEEVERMLTAVNVSRVFTQFLMLILFYFIEVARTLLLNTFTQWGCVYWLSLMTNIRWLNTLLRVQQII